MIRILFVLSPLLALFVAAGDYMSLEEAKEFASRYYSNIEKTVRTGKEPTSEEEYIKMFGRDKNGHAIYTAVNDYPNYVFLLSDDESVERGDSPESIFGDIAEFKANNKKLTFNFKCSKKNNYCRPPEMTKSEDKPQFAWFHFQTKWEINGGEPIIIDDTVFVDLKNRNISKICNKFCTLKDSPEVTLDGMMMKATALYSRKNYSEAASLYRKILKMSPGNDEAWYYLGVMYFKGQGVGKLTKKQRLQNAYNCWKKSGLKKARRAISFITDGRE